MKKCNKCNQEVPSFEDKITKELLAESTSLIYSEARAIAKVISKYFKKLTQ